MTTTQKRRIRTLRDRLVHLSYVQASKLLGPQAKSMLRSGGEFLDAVDIDCDVYFRGDLFRLILRDADVADGTVRVTITQRGDT